MVGIILDILFVKFKFIKWRQYEKVGINVVHPYAFKHDGMYKSKTGNK